MADKPYLEGKAAIKYGEGAFLNPKAKLLRDISMAFVSAFAKNGSSLIDPTAATGIRGIRYYLETPAKDITFLDMNRSAFLSAKKNILFNKVRAKTYNKSIQEFANSDGGRFDVVDFDPFGGVAPTLYDIMKMIKNGSLLMLTATDTAVLSGAHSNACIRIYGAVPMHNELCHETGLRILIAYAASLAAQFNFGIRVSLGMSYAHYFRVFIHMEHGSKPALDSLKQMGYAYYCSSCAFRLLKKERLPSLSACPECGNKIGVFGRMWAGSIISHDDLSKVSSKLSDVKDSDSAKEFVHKLGGELDVPLYYSVPKMTKLLGMPSVSPINLMKLLQKKGYGASRTHFDLSSIKTDAPLDTIKGTIIALGK